MHRDLFGPRPGSVAVDADYFDGLGTIVSIGTLVLATEHEIVRWFGLLCAAFLWAAAMLATGND